MAQLQELLDRIWEDYTRVNPQARAIVDMLASRGESIVNDHIAFRTFDDPRVGVDALVAPFVQFGYELKDTYDFSEKKLSARYYEHHDEGLPKVFISEMRTAEFSPGLRDAVTGLVDKVSDNEIQAWGFPVSGRPWPVSYAVYEKLRSESAYAGWLAAWGFRANHFTVLVNALKSIPSLEALSELLKDNGFALNSRGG